MTSPTIFIMLRSERGRYRSGRGLQPLTAPSIQDALRTRLETSCERLLSPIEVDGRLYESAVFVSPHEPGVAFAETDRDGVPVDAPPRLAWSSDVDRFREIIRQRCLRTDGLTPDTSVRLDSAFIPPQFEVVSPAASAMDSGTGQLSWEGLREHSRLVILGDPGAGKSACLGRMVLELTEHRSRHDTLPVLLQLRDVALDELTVAGVRRILSRAQVPLPETEFEPPYGAGRLTLLLDGLDEVAAPDDRRRVLERIRELCVAAPRLRVVLTSREPSYDGGLDDFMHVRLKGFSDIQITQWSSQYFGEVDEGRRWRVFVHAVRNDPVLEELVRNPLMLGLATSLYGRYPDDANDRVELYSRCVDALVHDWDAARGIGRFPHSSVTPRQITALLGAVSATMLVDDRREFTAEDVYRLIGGTSGYRATPTMLINACHQSGLVTANDDGAFHFSHHSLQEFLAASHIVRHGDDLRPVLGALSGHQTPRVAWVLVFAQCTDPADLLRQVIDRVSTAERPYAAVLFLAQALALEASAPKDIIAQCCESVAVALGTLLAGSDILSAEAGPDVARPGEIELGRLGFSVEADEESRRRLERARELLVLLYRVRGGTAWPALRSALREHAVSTVADLLDHNGRFEAVVIPGEEHHLLWTVVAGEDGNGDVFR